MGQQKEREKMNMLIKILKNIGVIVLAIALFVVGSIPGNLLVSVFTNEYLQLIIPSIVSILVTFGLVWFVSGKLLKIDAEELGIKLKKVDVKWIVIAVALPVLILLFYAFVLPGKPYVSGDEGLVKSLIKGFFEAGITAGLLEELVFRGMIFRYMKKTLGVKAAVIVPAVLFASMHILNMQTFNWMDLILLIFAGSSVAIMFTMMALKSNTIYAGACAHALWNTLIIGGTFGIGDIVNGMENTSYIVIPIESTSKLLTGGNFGVEAAVPAIVGYIAVSVICAIGFREKEAPGN